MNLLKALKITGLGILIGNYLYWLYDVFNQGNWGLGIGMLVCLPFAIYAIIDSITNVPQISIDSETIKKYTEQVLQQIQNAQPQTTTVQAVPVEANVHIAGEA